MTISLGTAGYAAAALLFLVLSIMLATRWREGLQGKLLAAACLVTALWAGAAAYLPVQPNSSVAAVDILEVLRSATWFAFLIALFGFSSKNVAPLRHAAVAVVTFCGVLLAAKLISGAEPISQLDVFVLLSRLILSMLGIFLVEHLYRSVAPQDRWRTKFLCVGLGSLFVYDFYLYSDALLFRGMNADIWAARGIVNAMVVPLLAVATARNPKWSVNVAISRRVLFHSTALLGGAVYLLVMAAAGYYIRYFGGSWGPVLQVTFFFGASLLLVAILLSGSLRARLKVFLNKNFFSYHYDYREEWLRFTGTLSQGEPGVQLYERSIVAIAELVGSSGGALWLCRHGSNLEQVAAWNMPSVKETEPRDNALCQFLEQRQWVVSLPEYEAQPVLYDNLEMPPWLRSLPDAWLVVPLILDMQILGFVVLGRSKGRIELNWEVIDVLKVAGRQAASYLAQFEAAKALLVARQFESFNRMSAFLVHDLKNLVSLHSLLLSNADNHKHEPEFQEDMIETIAQSVEKMKRLLLELQGGYTLEPPAPVPLEDVVERAVTARSGLKPAPSLEVCDSAMKVAAHAARLERVIGHLIQNAIEATPAKGQVLVQVLRKNDSAVVAIIDAGCGMSEQFVHDRLFQPFESSKSTGMGIGAYEAREYVRELGGGIEVETQEAMGTVFRVTLPIYLGSYISEQDIAPKGRE
jgi:putative PEP-CTERM system histidine kinase